jgi:hypothetical protein
MMPSRRTVGPAIAATAGCLDRVRGSLAAGDDRRLEGGCTQPTATWPTAGGDSRRSGRTTVTTPSGDAEAVSLSLGRRDTGRPVIGDDWVAFGRTNEGVTVYDRASGDERTSWSRDEYALGTIAGVVPTPQGFVVRGGTTPGLTLLR